MERKLEYPTYLLLMKRKLWQIWYI